MAESDDCGIPKAHLASSRPKDPSRTGRVVRVFEGRADWTWRRKPDCCQVDFAIPDNGGFKASLARALAGCNVLKGEGLLELQHALRRAPQGVPPASPHPAKNVNHRSDHLQSQQRSTIDQPLVNVVSQTDHLQSLSAAEHSQRRRGRRGQETFAELVVFLELESFMSLAQPTFGSPLGSSQGEHDWQIQANLTSAVDERLTRPSR